MLLETSGSEEEHDLAKLEQLLEKSVDDGVVVDGAIAQDLAQGKGEEGRRRLDHAAPPLASPPFHLKPRTPQLMHTPQRGTCGSCGS